MNTSISSETIFTFKSVLSFSFPLFLNFLISFFLTSKFIKNSLLSEKSHLYYGTAQFKHLIFLSLLRINKMTSFNQPFSIILFFLLLCLILSLSFFFYCFVFSQVLIHFIILLLFLFVQFQNFSLLDLSGLFLPKILLLLIKGFGLHYTAFLLQVSQVLIVSITFVF